MLFSASLATLKGQLGTRSSKTAGVLDVRHPPTGNRTSTTVGKLFHVLAVFSSSFIAAKTGSPHGLHTSRGIYFLKHHEGPPMMPRTVITVEKSSPW